MTNIRSGTRQEFHRCRVSKVLTTSATSRIGQYFSERSLLTGAPRSNLEPGFIVPQMFFQRL